MKILLITSNSLRHKFLACKLKNQQKIKLKKVFFEDNSSAKANFFKNPKIKKYFKERDEYEKAFFQNFVNLNIKSIDEINQKISNINDLSILQQIKKIKIDFVICYGTSILSEKFLKSFKNKIINIHLGLSPYYRGVATNFFPILNKQPEYIGGTLLLPDNSIDGGKIIHQKQAKILPNDNIHTVGFRLVSELIDDLIFILKKEKKHLDKIIRKYKKGSLVRNKGKLYFRKEFSLEKIFKAKKYINYGLFKTYKKKKIKLVELF